MFEFHEMRLLRPMWIGRVQVIATLHLIAGSPSICGCLPLRITNLAPRQITTRPPP
jgi:hypothetical protein